MRRVQSPKGKQMDYTPSMSVEAFITADVLAAFIAARTGITDVIIPRYRTLDFDIIWDVDDRDSVAPRKEAS